MLRIQLKFWWMTTMGVKYNHTILTKKLNGGARERDSQVADLRFKIRRKWPENAFFFCAVWVLRMFPEGSICIGINLDDKQTPI